MNVKKIVILFIVGALLLLLLFFSSIVSLITDWWWFLEVNYSEIFIKTLTTRLVLGVSAGIITFLFLFSNFYIATHSKNPWFASLPAALVGQPVSINGSMIKRFLLLLSILLAVLIGFVTASFWKEVLQYLSATPFNQKDPLLGFDISFYVFTLPVYSVFLGLMKLLLGITLVVVVLTSLLRKSSHVEEILRKMTLRSNHKIKHDAGSLDLPEVHHHTRMQLGFLVFLFLVATAITTYLSIFNLLLTQSGPIFGAAYTDASVVIPILKISVYAYVLAAFFALVYALSGKITPLLISFGMTLIIGIVGFIVPTLIQRFIVAPNELVKETPYIAKNITATRDAYNLQNIEKRQITADQTLSPEDIVQNNATIKNVRLWDREPLLSTFSQIQEIRTYYEFAAVDNDRYVINGELRQIMLSPRELQPESLPNRNWINERLTFTHGYGIAAGPVNQVTPEGLPVLFVKNLPPVTNVKELTVNRPEIYFGEINNSYVIVNSNSKEFDYPKGDENVYTEYAGTGGISLNSVLRRIFYAFHFNELKMILSGDITDKSRIMYVRNVFERVQKIAPFLTFDHDPYLVVVDGKLFWILDAYTHTDRYPYSQPTETAHGKVNYIRNSVKVVVDAYHGTVTMYTSDTTDPIIRTYTKMFPTSFKPLSSMPKNLIPHLRYPEDIFSIQTSIYTIYHMDDPQIFYNKEDQWEIPSVTVTSAQTENPNTLMSPRHMIMKLPNVDREEFILMLPFTPRAKDNLSAWMVARNDGDNYGQLVVYSFPKDKLVFGPKQIIGRINQDAEVSRQIALWDQRGSQVIQGPLLVIPIEESLVYVRPLYLKAESGKIPELKRVIVAYENKIAMEETLEEGLGRIFGTEAAAPELSQNIATGSARQNNPTDTQNDDLTQQINDAYTKATEAQKNGDWARYGEEIKKLGDLIKRLK